MSEDVERRLVAVLGRPTTSPYGNPIPGLTHLGVDQQPPAGSALTRLSEIPPGTPTAVVVRRLAEHVQVDTETLGALRDVGVVPNARVTVNVDDEGVHITAVGHESFLLPEDLAHAVQVEAIP